LSYVAPPILSLRLLSSSFLQKEKLIGIYKNFVVWTCVCVDRMTWAEVELLKTAVDKLDNKERVIRPQTFKERSLTYAEYEQLGRLVLERTNNLVRNAQLVAMLDNIIHTRWVNWTIKVAAHPANDEKYISNEAGITFSIDVDRNISLSLLQLVIR
jgi:hypothetical protein